jgi:hypothetical protein
VVGEGRDRRTCCGPGEYCGGKEIRVSWKAMGVQRMQKFLVAKTGDIEGKVLVGFGTLYEVRASSGRFKIPLVHYPSKH